MKYKVLILVFSISLLFIPVNATQVINDALRVTGDIQGDSDLIVTNTIYGVNIRAVDILFPAIGAHIIQDSVNNLLKITSTGDILLKPGSNSKVAIGTATSPKHLEVTGNVIIKDELQVANSLQVGGVITGSFGEQDELIYSLQGIVKNDVDELIETGSVKIIVGKTLAEWIPLWTKNYNYIIDDGKFSVVLGEDNNLDLNLYQKYELRIYIYDGTAVDATHDAYFEREFMA